MKALVSCAIVAIATFVAGVASARTVNVSTATELTTAISAAAAGDEIVLAAGTYHLTGASCSASGTAAAPIVVRSATPLAAKIEFDALEGFHVTAPNWHFEGLDIKGVCADDNNCEHAFHVTGAASGFVMRGNRVFDFNAQLKVNADKDSSGKWITPDNGLVEGNEIGDSHPRATSNPVTKLNIDTVSNWIVRANYLHDGHKNGGDGVSYQSFMKGGGKNGLYERNLVICARDDASGGTRIGLSFGGGGTAPQFCEPAFDPAVPCVPEHTSGVMRNNVIVNCSDVGIYLNQSKDTKVLYNTLVATSGIDFRFASTSGEADGNVMAGKIRTRDGGAFTAGLNLTDLTAAQFAAFYVDPLHGDLKKKGDLSSLLQKGAKRADVFDDYCARARSDAKLDLGALESTLGDCDTTRPPLGGVTPPVDAGGIDSGSGDSGPSSDSATTDGGASDSSTSSDGSISDGSAGEVGGDDAGAPGNPADSSSSSSSGCGCRTSDGTDASRAWSIASLIVVSAVLRRRRRSA